MIKFFRQIRQNLLSEGKTGKYVKYAIGEIALVVIGILIALTINNRNERNNFNNNVLIQLKQISVELEDDISIIDQRMKDYPFYLDYLEKLSKGNYEELDLNLFVGIVAGNDDEILFGDSYNILKNIGGINKIKDKNLRNMLGEYNNRYRVKLNQEIEYGKKLAIGYIDITTISFMEYDINNKLVEENTINVIKEKK